MDYLIKNNRAQVILTDVKNINFYLAWMKENNLKAVLAEPEEQSLERWEARLCHQIPPLCPLGDAPSGLSYQLAYSLAMGVFEWQGIKNLYV